MPVYSKRIEASKETPYLLCLTCGLATSKLVIRNKRTASLRNEKRKTWKRTIKPSSHRITSYNNRLVKAKDIYFSYIMLSCIQKKHKLSIRKAPFSYKMVRLIK